MGRTARPGARGAPCLSLALAVSAVPAYAYTGPAGAVRQDRETSCTCSTVCGAASRAGAWVLWRVPAGTLGVSALTV